MSLAPSRLFFPAFVLSLAALIELSSLHAAENPSDVSGVDPQQIAKSAGPAFANLSPAVSPLPQVRMVSVKDSLNPLTPNAERENPPFGFRGGSGTGRIVDRKGAVLLESTEEMGIFGAVLSSDGERVLVDAENKTGGNCVVLEPTTGRKIQLPSRPPGVRLFSLSWDWMGAHLLLGTSGVQRLTRDQSPNNGGAEDNVAETRLYTFDLLTETLSEAIIPGATLHPSLRVKEVRENGQIHLLLEDGDPNAEQDLGWFKVEAPKKPALEKK